MGSWGGPRRPFGASGRTPTRFTRAVVSKNPITELASPFFNRFWSPEAAQKASNIDENPENIPIQKTIERIVWFSVSGPFLVNFWSVFGLRNECLVEAMCYCSEILLCLVRCVFGIVFSMILVLGDVL